MWVFCLFFFSGTATTDIYTLSLHDALPISGVGRGLETVGEPWAGAGPWKEEGPSDASAPRRGGRAPAQGPGDAARSEEHTSELQSRLHLVCRLLLEKKKKNLKMYLPS